MRLDVQKICDSTCPRRQGLVFQRRREAEGSDGSVDFQWTASLEARGMIVGCSERLPASLDVLSPCFLGWRGPESDLKRGPETPAGALKLPSPGGDRLQPKQVCREKQSRQGSPGSVSLMDWEAILVKDIQPDQEASRPRRNRGYTARARTEQRLEPRRGRAPCYCHGLRGGLPNGWLVQ